MRALVKEQHADAALVHKVATIELPVRAVTEVEAAEARSKVRDALQGASQPPSGRMAPRGRRPLRAAEGRPRRFLPHGTPRDPPRRRRDRDQCLRALHRVRDPDQGPQSGDSRRSSSNWPGPARTCRPRAPCAAGAIARSWRVTSSARKEVRSSRIGPWSSSIPSGRKADQSREVSAAGKCLETGQPFQGGQSQVGEALAFK